MTTHETVVDLLKDIVSGREDFVAACRYVDGDGDPVCIVGHLLNRLAPEHMDAFRKDDILNGTRFNQLISEHMIEGLSESLSMGNRTIRLLRAVQSCQDRGESWGEALQFGLDKVTV